METRFLRSWDEEPNQNVMEIPNALVPAVRELIARH
jgi:hypothetical protein